jgi:serine/threonine protein kinase/lipopolysaccharide biosynthesis regulator YciM
MSFFSYIKNLFKKEQPAHEAGKDEAAIPAKAPSKGGTVLRKPDDVKPIAEDKADEDAEVSPWKVDRVILNEYIIERELGEGGMGKVYLLKSRTTSMRFAVKRTKGLSDKARRDFLAELQTWIDLPEHPNLVPCRFFRTVGDEVLIFAEYVEGGSLKDWIDSRKLYEGGQKKALERILDLAIQFAWGLHCVHELGLVHQDVKPANVMVAPSTNSGQGKLNVAVQGVKARVTDYGLARARAAGGERYVPELGRGLLVSSGGYTQAYCSPEQAAGRKLDQRTDVWSWGVSVMEMFHGGVSWYSGSIAAEALEAFLEHNGEEEHIPAMPAEVAAVLKGCFQRDPAQRWEDLAAVVQMLKVVYRSVVGAVYSRALGTISRSDPQAGVGERRARHGASWTDPQIWLEQALRAEGRDAAEVAEIVTRHGSSRRGQLVADVATYDEARRVYERLVKGGRKDLRNDLADLCNNAAFVHTTADDTSGALALYDRAIEIRERLVNVEGRREISNGLAGLYMNKANVVTNIGDNRSALALYDRASEIYERLVNVEGRRELANDLARLYSNKGNAVRNLGNNRDAVALYDRAIEIYKRLVNVGGRRELANDLAKLYLNKANAVKSLGDNRAAVALYDQAIEIYEQPVNVEGRRELANVLPMLYMNKAGAVSNLGDNRAAVALYDQASEIYERLVNVEGRRELANELAMIYMNKAGAVMILGDNRAAVALYDRAIEIYERLVNVEGRRELAHELARIYTNKADAVMDMGDNHAAVTLYDRAIEILVRLVNVEGRSELAHDMASIYTSKAIAVRNLGDNRAAVALYDQAIEIRERLVNVDGRSELANDLAKLYFGKAMTVGLLGDFRAEVALHDRAIEILERLVNVDGRRELANELAELYSIKSMTVGLLKNFPGRVGAV